VRDALAIPRPRRGPLTACSLPAGPLLSHRKDALETQGNDMATDCVSCGAGKFGLPWLFDKQEASGKVEAAVGKAPAPPFAATKLHHLVHDNCAAAGLVLASAAPHPCGAAPEEDESAWAKARWGHHSWLEIRPFTLATSVPDKGKSMSGMVNMLSHLYDFLVNESRKNNISLLLLPTREKGGAEDAKEGSDKEDAEEGNDKERGASCGPLRLIGWEIENVTAWFRNVNEWYKEISGGQEYKQSALSMMLRRNGFRPWNTSAVKTMGSGWDYRLRRKDVNCHGYILDAEVLQKYGIRQRQGEKTRRLEKERARAEELLTGQVPLGCSWGWR